MLNYILRLIVVSILVIGIYKLLKHFGYGTEYYVLGLIVALAVRIYGLENKLEEQR